MIEEFGNDQHREYQTWVESHRDGYVWNVAKGVLHKATCRTIAGGLGRLKRRASTITKKRCSTSRSELVTKAKDDIEVCGYCKP